MMHQHPRRNASDLRRAFTLIELLVVIAIIGILASLAAWGVFAMIGRSHNNNTQSTMKVVTKLMTMRLNHVNAESKKESASPVAVLLANGPAGGLDPTGARAKVIMAKARLIEAFPMTYGEVTAPNMYITQAKPHVAKYKSTVAGMASGGPGESAACLLMALKTLQGDSGVAVEDQLKHAIGLTDGNPANPPIPTLQDSWGTPMGFFRFPVNWASVNVQLQAKSLPLIQANPAGANARNARFADPNDPEGVLVKTDWYGSLATYPAAYPIIPWRGLTARQVYEATFHVIAVPGSNPPAANYTIPVISSAGPNTKLGLAADLTATPDAADNIFSIQLKLD